MNFKGFVGPSYTLKSVNVECQRSVNLYPELIESGNGKDGNAAYLKSAPGLKKTLTVGTGPIRLIHYNNGFVAGNTTGNILVVSGDEAYEVKYNETTDVWTSVKLGDLTPMAIESPISAVTTIQTVNPITIFVNKDNSYIYIPGSPSTFASFAMYGWPPVFNATHVVNIDGFLIYNDVVDDLFRVSEWNSLSVNALDFAASEGNFDKILAIATKNRELWVFNERTTEVFVNTGNAAFPFERMGGGYIEMGCLSPYSPQAMNGVMFWLGRNESGQAQVFQANGLSPQRISTHAVEQAINSYAHPEKAKAYTYSSEGHHFYVLNFDEATWCYDSSTSLWHERASLDNGVLKRNIAENCAFLSYANKHIVGSSIDGSIYEMSENYYSQDTEPLVRLRSFPHITGSMKNTFYNSLQLDIEAGVGLTTGQGSDPQIMLQYSNDSGHTWSSENWTSMGKSIGGVGEYLKRIIWRRLGKSRDKVFRITITDPVKVTMISAQIDAVEGAS